MREWGTAGWLCVAAGLMGITRSARAEIPRHLRGNAPHRMEQSSRAGQQRSSTSREQALANPPQGKAAPVDMESTRMQTGGAAAGPSPESAPSKPGYRLQVSPKSAQVLFQELQAMEVLARLKLTPAQMHSAAVWIARADGLEGGPVDIVAAAERVTGFLRKERDLLASHQPLPDTLINSLTSDQSIQAAWQSRQDRYLQNAAQALLFTLTQEQKDALVAVQPPPSIIQAARTLLQDSTAMNPAGYPDLKATIQRRYPDAANGVISILDKARALKTSELTQQKNNLVAQLVEVMAPPAAPVRSSETDPQLANTLITILHYLPVQQAIQRASKLFIATGAAEKGPGRVELSRGEPGSLEALDSLKRDEANLQQQIQSLTVLSSLGFSRSQLETAVPWLQKADDLRRQSGDKEHDITSELVSAIQETTDAVVRGQKIPADVQAGDFLNGIQFQQQNLRADLQLAAMSMLNAMPIQRVAEYAQGEPVTQRYTRVLTLLTTVRSETLIQFLYNETSLSRQLLAQQTSPAKDKVGADKIKDILRQVRMMTEAEFQANAVQIVQSILGAGQPAAVLAARDQPELKPLAAGGAAPTKSSTPAARSVVGKVVGARPDAKTEQQMAEEEETQNRASQVLAYVLDVPGLSELLRHQ